MHFKLVCVASLPIDTLRTQNIGYDYGQVVAALTHLDGHGHSHEELDGNRLSPEEREELMGEVRMAFVYPSKKGRKLGNSYGTNSQPWQDFGAEIPALLVYDDGRCVDAYPHQENARTITVTEYLTSLD